MANVIISRDSFAPYKWDTAVFPYDNGLSLSSWDNAGVASWSIKVEEDTFSIADGERNTFDKRWADSVSMKESIAKNIDKQTAIALALNEAFYRQVNYGINAEEKLSFEEKLSKAISAGKAERFGVADSISKETIKESFSSLSIREAFDREARYYLYFDESTKIADSLVKEYGLTPEETISLIDEYCRACNMVISDIVFFDGEKTINELADRDTPVGFSPFREFIPGDWNYKDAIFKVVVESTDVTATPGISEWKLNIDVPDVFDKGTYECKAGTSSSVKFNRRFWDIPDITIKIRGDDSASLHIANLVTTTEGFTFDLMDSNNTQAAGAIYWKAEGY